jgi:ureidoacrylate peracid hydrolase
MRVQCRGQIMAFRSEDRVNLKGDDMEITDGRIAIPSLGPGELLRLDPSDAAVIVVDMQQDFVHDLGAFGRFDRTQVREIVEPTARFLTVAREAGVPVIYLKLEFQPDLSDAGRPGSKTRNAMEAIGLGQRVEGPDGRIGRKLVAGSWTTEIIPELSPEPSDIVVTKTRFSGFWGTNLEAILRELDVHCLIFAGEATSMCVESTVRDATYSEYNCITLSDCTADPFGRDVHEAALKRLGWQIGWVCNSIELSEALRTLRGTPAADPLAVVEALDAACNAGDLEGVMGLFARDAVVTQQPAPPDGGVYCGTEQIRAWFAPQLSGFHVDSHERQAHGERVTWKASMIADMLRQMGINEPVEASAEAVVRDGKIASFSVTNPAVGAAAEAQIAAARS